MRIKGFRALRPPRELAARVAAPPYDVVERDEAAAVTAANPLSFLHVSRPDAVLPPSVSDTSEEAYAKALENFRRFRRDGTLRQDASDAVFVYRIATPDHEQHGVLCCCRAADAETGVIRRHERTRKEKEDDRCRHIRTLGAQTGPVFIIYPDRADLLSFMAAAEEAEPLYDFTADDGNRHTVWRADASDAAARFAGLDRCYVADGHHRLAAAARAAQEAAGGGAENLDPEESRWFLALLYPASHARILPYHRLVLDLNGLDGAGLLAAASRVFKVRPADGARPAAQGHVRMYADGRWHDLNWAADPAADALSQLDVSVLQDRLLGPVLGVRDVRTSPRIAFSGGPGAAETLARRVDAGRARAAFSMHPVSVAQLMAVSDAGGIMPPKSTWFDPKPRSGLAIHLIGRGA